MEINKDETFLAKWMNNELNAEELEAFKKHPDFPLYEKIIFKSEKLAAPPYDKQKLLSKVKEEIEDTKKPKVVSLYSKLTIVVAASLLILFSVFYFKNSATIYSTNFGEQLAVNLPDDSEVILNAKSSISFKENEWSKARTINLKGEAFFKVNKGKTFTVETDLGKVTVLGTQFNVNIENDLLQVNCYEGKVKVSVNEKDVFLTKGKAFRITKDTTEEWEFKEKNPSWENGESSFNSVPLKYVIKAITDQYNVEINAAEDINLNYLYTGAFTHEDLKIALETVFTPLKIKFEFTNKSTILLVKH
ncbi:FecR family protein [Tenacibaculum sp. ZS6-P6]|uniref:FecR family protein n=1 Tax=Tenacibaculum sp. ZS6-P6 TaxID=3447503 RepID=UPI003F9D86E8